MKWQQRKSQMTKMFSGRIRRKGCMSKSVLKRLAVQVPTCKKCGGEMKAGKAIAQTYVASRESRGENDCVTMFAGGKGELVDCVKCSECGWSVS